MNRALGGDTTLARAIEQRRETISETERTFFQPRPALQLVKGADAVPEQDDSEEGASSEEDDDSYTSSSASSSIEEPRKKGKGQGAARTRKQNKHGTTPARRKIGLFAL